MIEAWEGLTLYPVLHQFAISRPSRSSFASSEQIFPYEA